ncbi:hypothetical protein CAPTEDRAFT_153068 [Capitella teleta]|uniref:Alanine--glyoxylate aminotransferase n=1 Tax=Capitella teleta TaxID=283909 RepID=R7TPS8_CAPTE|nr:hypothetical protein CAPTEDRAFT_153068 [Capitella teleta]|eukprot:ELT93050.1 hypothetical protein CAPTEDRAFT_153068 [Capitella teleta]
MEKRLFTPGPLGVSMTTKEAMLRDVGSRDQEFISLVKNIRMDLIMIAGVDETDFTCIPLQGSGTFCIEAVLSTFVPREGKVLILENGAYGKRQAAICRVLGINYQISSFPEDSFIRGEDAKVLLERDGPFSMLSIVHCETSSGVINRIEEVGDVLKEFPETAYFVDAMSSFGAVPIDMKLCNMDVLVSSANKCIEGVPGFGFAICRRSLVAASKGNARSYCLDLVDQNEGLDKNGQFRFTPPTHAMLAFNQALTELHAEGGVNARSARYQSNRAILRQGMQSLGFQEFLSSEHTGYIITSYYFPKHPKFNFQTFYENLSKLGFVIYPGKVLDADCFRIGNIGNLHARDMQELLTNIETVLSKMCP